MNRRSVLAGLGLSAIPGLVATSERACALQSSDSVTYAADFRGLGLNDRQVLDAAFRSWSARGGILELEQNRVYDLGLQHTGGVIFTIFGLSNAVLNGNGATLQIQTSGDIAYNLLYLAYYQNLRIRNLHAIDTGYLDSWVRGAKFIVLDTGERDSENITLENVTGESLLSFIQVQGPPGRSRVRGIRIEANCRATRVFYGLNCQNQGDDISGGFTAINCGRAYFPYGISGHDLAISIHHQGRAVAASAESAVLIKSYGPTTSNIRLDLIFSGALPWQGSEDGRERSGSCVTLEHQHDPVAGPSIIEDVDLSLNIEPNTADPYGAHRIAFRSYLANGTEQTGYTENIWRRIRIDGNLRPGTSPAIFSRVAPIGGASITVARGALGAGPQNIAAPAFRFVTG